MTETKQTQQPEPTADELRIAAAVHERVIAFMKAEVVAGTDPALLSQAALTVAVDGILQVQGRLAAMKALMDCFRPIRLAVAHDAAAGSETRQ